MYLELADRMGLHCKYDEGDAQSSNGEWGGHAWNLVKIEGQWRAVDATWAAGNDLSLSAILADLRFEPI